MSGDHISHIVVVFYRSGTIDLNNVSELNNIVSSIARDQGFALIGFARIRPLNRGDFYNKWLADGRQGEMAYLGRNPHRRLDPRTIDSRLRSVISLAYPYRAAHPPRIDWRRELRGRIASYAFGADYHDVVLKKADKVAAALAALRPDSISRTYVDTGPVFEREWAFESGLGWFGKNTTMLNREDGSYFFLAEIFTDVDLDPTNERQRDHCGTCRRCLDLCPTGALSEGYLMEPRICISYLTIELKSAIPPQLRPKISNWIFGCDICQEVCPWNVEGDEDGDSELAPRLLELMQLDREGFRRRFGKTAVARAKRRGLLRNVAVALGNSGNQNAVPVLAHTLANEEEPLVRAHVAWALGQLRSALAHEALARQRICETDDSVQKEIADALEFF